MIQHDLRRGKRRHPSQRTLEERTTTNGGMSYRQQLDTSPHVLPASTTGGRAERNRGGESPLSGATGSGVCPGSYIRSASLGEKFGGQQVRMRMSLWPALDAISVIARLKAQDKLARALPSWSKERGSLGTGH
jgi:hypothetical protein